MNAHRLVHRGIVSARAFHFSGAEPDQRRVLAVWEAGSRVFTTPLGVLLWLPRDIACDCARAPGLPLVFQDGVLSAVPLGESSDGGHVDPGHEPGTVVIAHGGIIQRWSVHDLTPLDISTWLDLRSWVARPASPLGVPPPPPVEAVDGALSPHLPNAPEPAEAQRRMLASWSERATAAAQESTGMLGWMLERMKQQFGGPRPGRADGDSLLAGLRRTAHGHIADPRLADHVARQQKEYIQRMLALFERGDLGEALRHALPLEDVRDSRFAIPSLGVPAPRATLDIRPQRPASLRGMGVPREFVTHIRQLYAKALEQLLQEGRVDEAAFVLAELMHDIEGAVALLEERGQQRLAAELAEARRLPPGLVVRQWFVAGDTERAVRVARRTGAFGDAVRRLERSDPAGADTLRLRWAETLAASGDFEGAVRAAWALAAMHDDGTIDGWIDRVVSEGGPAGARMLVLALAGRPPLAGEGGADAAAPHRARRLGEALALLRDDREVVSGAREALVDALLHATRSTDETVRLARDAVRTVSRSQGRGCFNLDARAFGKLVDGAHDPVLRADLPPYVEPAPPSLLVRANVPEIVLDAVGTVAVADAALLPDGRVLAALGEAGLRLLTADGRTVAHFDHPAHRLVVADSGTRVIAVGLRGAVQRLTRVDLTTRRAERWCEAQLEAWADDYDGSQWFVAHGSADGPGAVVAVDTLAAGFEILTRVARSMGRTVCISRAAGSCGFVVATLGIPMTLWSGWYTMSSGVDETDPGNRLPTPLWLPTGGVAVAPDGGCAILMGDVGVADDIRSKRDFSAPSVRTAQGIYGRAALKSRTGDRWVEVFLRGPQDIGRVLGRAGAGPSFGPGDWPAVEGPPPPPWSSEVAEPRPVASHDFVAGVLRIGGGMVCTLINRALYGETLRIYLRGARQASVRLNRRHLVVGDSLGRIAVVDVRNGRLTHQLRIVF